MTTTYPPKGTADRAVLRAVADGNVIVDTDCPGFYIREGNRFYPVTRRLRALIHNGLAEWVRVGAGGSHFRVTPAGWMQVREP